MRKQPANGLWTRDFIIIQAGSVVSMLGNAMAGFAISLFVLDYTETPLYYALYIFLYTLPQIAAPVIAGPLMDKFSRRRTIYLLDFLASAIYLTMGLLIHMNAFNFAVLSLMTLVTGSIHSVYMVAFSSFYPLLITPGNYSKAYSVSSTLETLSYVMIPVATFLYKSMGIFPLLIANSICFFIAALFETRISDVEAVQPDTGARYSMKAYLEDAKEGVRYLWSEKGLMLIAVYFMFSSLAGGASSVITLPWFRESFADGEYIYMSVWAFMVIGRVMGGLINYRMKLPEGKKFVFALMVYLSLSFIEGSYLYLPVSVMRLCCFLVGILSATSYNIRISATQAYVPHEKKGRFNGAFLMLTTVGSLSGELLAGITMTVLPVRLTLTVFMAVNFLAAIFIVGGGGRHIRPIYNREV